VAHQNLQPDVLKNILHGPVFMEGDAAAAGLTSATGTLLMLLTTTSVCSPSTRAFFSSLISLLLAPAGPARLPVRYRVCSLQIVAVAVRGVRRVTTSDVASSHSQNCSMGGGAGAEKQHTMEGPSASGEKLQMTQAQAKAHAMAQAKVRIAEMVLQERQQVNSLRPASSPGGARHGGSGVYGATPSRMRRHWTPCETSLQIREGFPASLPAHQL
jgi:hypothetical protein